MTVKVSKAEEELYKESIMAFFRTVGSQMRRHVSPSRMDLLKIKQHF